MALDWTSYLISTSNRCHASLQYERGGEHEKLLRVRFTGHRMHDQNFLPRLLSSHAWYRLLRFVCSQYERFLIKACEGSIRDSRKGQMISQDHLTLSYYYQYTIPHNEHQIGNLVSIPQNDRQFLIPQEK